MQTENGIELAIKQRQEIIEQSGQLRAKMGHMNKQPGYLLSYNFQQDEPTALAVVRFLLYDVISKQRETPCDSTPLSTDAPPRTTLAA